MKLLVVIAFLSHIVCSQDYSPLSPKTQVKRSYVCPPKFIRQGHRCYYFSKHAVTWHEALFHCRDMKSNLAIIKTRHQDNLIRNFLSRKTLNPLERWLGGVYDWGNMSWKWAASGKTLAYNGFSNSTKEESLRWHCIVMDPALQYRWNSRSCVDKKHYICHTKMKTMTNRSKKKLQRQYNSKLNEIPVPELPQYSSGKNTLKSNFPYKIEINRSLNDQALAGYAPEPQIKKPKKTRRKKKNKKGKFIRYKNGTVVEVPRTKRQKNKETNKESEAISIENIKWRTYKKEGELANPLLPRPIVEEYNFVKD